MTTDTAVEAVLATPIAWVDGKAVEVPQDPVVFALRVEAFVEARRAEQQ